MKIVLQPYTPHQSQLECSKKQCPLRQSLQTRKGSLLLVSLPLSNPTKLTKTMVEDGGRGREALHPELLPNAKVALIDETQVHS